MIEVARRSVNLAERYNRHGGPTAAAISQRRQRTFLGGNHQMATNSSQAEHDPMRDIQMRLKKLETLKAYVVAFGVVLGLFGTTVAVFSKAAADQASDALVAAKDAEEKSEGAAVTAESASSTANAAKIVSDNAVVDINNAGKKQLEALRSLGERALDSLSSEIASGLGAIVTSQMDASKSIADAALQEQGLLNDQRDALVRQLDNRARDLQASLDAATADQIRMSPQAVLDSLTNGSADLSELAASLITTSAFNDLTTSLDSARRQLAEVSENGIGPSIKLEPRIKEWQTADRAGFVLVTVRGGPDSGLHGTAVLTTRGPGSRERLAMARTEWSRQSSATGSVFMPVAAGHEWIIELGTSGGPNPDVNTWWFPLGPAATDTTGLGT